MTNAVKISCTLDTTNPEASLGFEAWIDNHKFFDTEHVQTQHHIVMEISDDIGEHELRFVLKNKTSMHTQVDQAGNIVSDATLRITDLSFDEIQLGHMITEQAIYTHNFNGTSELTQNKFYSELGCNGTVSFKFTTPIYMWLLENM